MPVRSGLNRVTLRALEGPTAQLPNEPRTMMIGVEKVSVSLRSAGMSSDQPNSALPLIGYVDIPQQEQITTSATADFSMAGWVVWGQKAQTVRIMLDGAELATAPVNISRPDVARVHPQYASANAGWGTLIPAGRIPPGARQITVQVVSQSGQTRDLKTLSVNVTR